MKNYPFWFRIFLQWLGIFVFCIIVFGLSVSFDFINQLLEISIKQQEIIMDLEKRLDSKEKDYNLLMHYINENSGIPNEKRKAVFNLKMKQDSILINFLLNDIRANKEIINLLNTDWVYNDSTEFESLKTK